MKRLSRQTFETELDHIIQSLRRYAPEKAILFGSFARGDYHAGSDVDLLIVKDIDQPFTERGADVLRACPSALALEPLVYTPAELQWMIQQDNPFIRQVLAEGVVIYESQPG